MTTDIRQQLLEEVWAQEGTSLVIRALEERLQGLTERLCNDRFDRLDEVARLQGQRSEVRELLRGIREPESGYFLPEGVE